MRGLSKCYSYISRWPTRGTWNIINGGKCDEVYLANRRTEWHEEKRLKTPLKLSETKAFRKGWNKNGSQNIPASAAFPRAAERSWEAGEDWVGTIGRDGCKDCEKIARNVVFTGALMVQLQHTEMDLGTGTELFVLGCDWLIRSWLHFTIIP